ncbi:MAG: ATP-binding protein, partial [Kiloniellaceae bacterium]
MTPRQTLHVVSGVGDKSESPHGTHAAEADAALERLIQVARSEDRLRQQARALVQVTKHHADARQEAERANETKSHFLASMSHELRTPLNAIIGITEIVLEDVRAAALEQFVEPLQRVHRAGEHLLMLINDILDISKIEAGKLTLWPQDTEVREIVADVSSTIEPLAAKNDNILRVECAEGSGRIYVDPQRLRQILLNLLSNACKFAQGGEIRLVVTRTREPDPGHIFFLVADTGVGMSADQVAILFQDYTQAESARSTKAEGTGLGLAISRRLAHMLGGDIAVESEPDRGSTFTLCLPVAVPATPANEAMANVPDPSLASQEESQPGPPARLLLVDPTGRLGRILGPLRVGGIGVAEAGHGAEAMRLARDTHPEVVVVDVSKGDSNPDSWQVLAALAAEQGLCGASVLLAAMPPDCDDDRALRFRGAYQCMAKPVDRACLRAHAMCMAGAANEWRLLLVDDDASARMFLRRTLRADGWSIVEAENGREALDRLGDFTPDVMVLDLNMPVLDGFGVVAALRRSETWADL